MRHRWQTHDSCASFVWEASVDQQASKNRTDFRRSTPRQIGRIEDVETDLERFELLVNDHERAAYPGVSVDDIDIAALLRLHSDVWRSAPSCTRLPLRDRIEKTPPLQGRSKPS